MATRILPLICSLSPPGSGASKLVAAIHASAGPRSSGLSLLHRAVRGGSLELIQGMLHWGKANGYRWVYFCTCLPVILMYCCTLLPVCSTNVLICFGLADLPAVLRAPAVLVYLA